MSTEIILVDEIKSKIFTIRGLQVMLDRDLAELYGVETKVLNQAVKRNIDRFPPEFLFRLNKYEKNELVTKCDRLEKLKHSSVNPNAFTEQGVAMLSGVLKTPTAINISITIIKSFVSMRKFLIENASIFQRIDKIEYKLLENDRKFEQIFTAMDNRKLAPTQGIFFNGQIFDAYNFVSDLIRSAKSSIILIDNYVDDSVLTLFTKRNPEVSVKIFTNRIPEQLKLDLQKFNSQYEPVEIMKFSDSHDRFLIIDNEELYHFGASLKDLGKKWFAFSKMEKSLLKNISIIK